MTAPREVQAELERIESDARRHRQTERQGPIPTLMILAFCLVAMAGEAAMSWFLWIEYRPRWTPGAIHLATVAVVAAAAWRFRPTGSPSRLLTLLALSTFFLGPFGPLGTLLALGLHALFRRRATPFEEWYASLFPEEVDMPSRRLFEMLTRGLADAAGQENVTSFTDVLQYGSIEQKRAVISLLSRDFRPEFAPALLSALSDPNPAVRVQAATAAANIEGDFLERAIELETRARRHPGDAEAQVRAARHFDDYAYSGILDEDRQRENRDKAQTYYRKALELDPARHDATLGVGRLLVRGDRLEEAESWFEEGFRRGVLGPSELSWYMEAAYRLGDFDKLRYAVAAFGDDILAGPGASDRMRDVIRVWQGHGAENDAGAAHA
ncbi:tetratricopeptide repeat protein [Minwuia thermotolerans]|uniref:Uncharacterized protein n=1 Tax=Minwuia thermotolerans TaxID=2056226 RepID=A0A2M9FZB0_9PROT|nr:hypothetical protein [Minwuia thermotolerans]PJK28798.1 hypothetical protein CVT23_15820 [Minwuia thermotolerans]